MLGFSTGDEQFDTSKNVKQKSILELYPELDFVIAKSLFKNKYKFWNWITILINIILALCISVLSILIIDIYTESYYISPDALSIYTLLLFAVIFFNLLRKIYISRKRNTLKQLYYIQSPHPSKRTIRKFSIFVDSNRKFGLIKNKNLKIVIPAVYDEMMWREIDRFIIATKNGETLILDTNNQLCI